MHMADPFTSFNTDNMLKIPLFDVLMPRRFLFKVSASSDSVVEYSDYRAFPETEK